MQRTPLRNYVRTYRRRAAFTQEEISLLVGLVDRTGISRIERGSRLPSLEVALALEALFGVPVAKLFAGTFNQVDTSVRARAQEFSLTLRTARPTKSIVRKLLKLSELAATVPDESTAPCS